MAATTDITYAGLRAEWPRSSGSVTYFMRDIPRKLADKEDPLVVPDYQRGRVWSDDQSARFIGFLAEGGTMAPVFVQRWPVRSDGSFEPDEIVDGLQRLTAICRFLDGSVPMELADGRRAFLRDLSERDQELFVGPGGPLVHVDFLELGTREDVLRFYIRLNRGGTPHSDADIDRVRAMLG